MPLRFVDTNGVEGRIDDDLSLSYTGREDIAESIERCIRDIDANGEPIDEKLGSIVFELPEACAVRSVTRVGDGG